MAKAWSEMTNLEREAFNAGAALKDKLLFDTGKGCSVCGHTPVVNVDGTYWLCGECVSEKLPSSPEEQEIVAWRYVNKKTRGLTYSNQPPDRVLGESDYEVTPLYERTTMKTEAR